jgi:GNAT superfamily N-acetyltransferase
MSTTYRILQPGDEAALESFLLPQLESSMFLLSNMRQSGLIDGDDRAHGAYAGAFEGDQLAGVVAHFWNGNIIPQSPPQHLDVLWRLAVEQSGRPLKGMVGPGEQCFAILDAMNVSPDVIHLAEREQLYTLALDALVVPHALAEGAVQVRRANAADVDLLAAWRADYSIEALDAADTPATRHQSRESIERQIAAGDCWVAVRDGERVAMAALNARIQEAVQVGGVYTPPDQRRKGYAKAAVAQSLRDARADGAAHAILFTSVANRAADSAYRAIGFNVVGDFAIILLREPGIEV